MAVAVDPRVDSIVEQERNRLLRRVDWRFLAGTPVSASSVCFGDATLARALGEMSSRIVRPEAALAGTDCDVAAAVNPDADTLRRAWSALRPGGTLYTEWTGVRSGGPWGVARKLTRQGFADIECYAPRPDPALGPARVWIPLESTPAVRYFLRNQARANAVPHRRFARTIRRALWLAGRGARFSHPLAVVARKVTSPTERRGDGSSAPNMPRPGFVEAIRTTLAEGWERWGLGPTPSRLSLLLQTGGPRSVSKVVALVFAEGRETPAVVLKVPRVPESVAPLRTEATALRALTGCAGVPRLLFAETHGDVFVVGESFVEGTPLVALERRARFESVATMATDWLITLAEGRSASAPSAWYDRLVESPLAEFVATFGPVLDREMVRETRERLRMLGPLPLVCEHRDFSPWNVLLTASGELGVLDWEGAELRGLPVLDLVYFLAYLTFVRDGSDDVPSRRASYRSMLHPEADAGAVAHRCLERYCERLRIPRAALGPLRLLVWLVHARSEYRRLVADAGGVPSRSALDGSLFVGLWREDLQRARST